jgi:hypothetical protein
MKVREVVQLTKPNLSGTARSVATDQTVRTAVPVEIPNQTVGRREPHQTVGRREPPGSRDIFAVADPNDGVYGELPPALDLSRINVPKTPHSRDLDFIKAQIARLPKQIEE